jgi:hypothetical protein
MRERIQVRAACPTCGPVLVDGELLRCEMEPAAPKPSRGLCELICPGCSRALLFPTAAAVLKALFEGGVQHSSGAVPFELLEAHTGPALSWDDLLDFKLALDASSWPQLELGA